MELQTGRQATLVGLGDLRTLLTEPEGMNNGRYVWEGVLDVFDVLGLFTNYVGATFGMPWSYNTDFKVSLRAISRAGRTVMNQNGG